jgi:hypothetical protein
MPQGKVERQLCRNHSEMAKKKTAEPNFEFRIRGCWELVDFALRTAKVVTVKDPSG